MPLTSAVIQTAIELRKHVSFRSILCASVPSFYRRGQSASLWPHVRLGSVISTTTWQMDISCISEPQCAHCHRRTRLLFCLCSDLLTCQHWNTSSASIPHAANIRWAAGTIAEQSRYYFITLPVNSGTHYLMYSRENDSLDAIFRSNLCPFPWTVFMI